MNPAELMINIKLVKCCQVRLEWDNETDWERIYEMGEDGGKETMYRYVWAGVNLP